MNSCHLGWGPVASTCEGGNEHSSFKNGEVFLGHRRRNLLHGVTARGTLHSHALRERRNHAATSPTSSFGGSSTCTPQGVVSSSTLDDDKHAAKSPRNIGQDSVLETKKRAV
jgi:hypothetical protein